MLGMQLSIHFGRGTLIVVCPKLICYLVCVTFFTACIVLICLVQLKLPNSKRMQRQLSTAVFNSCERQLAVPLLRALPHHQRHHGGTEEKRKMLSSKPSIVHATEVGIKGGSHLWPALWEAQDSPSQYIKHTHFNECMQCHESNTSQSLLVVL